MTAPGSEAPLRGAHRAALLGLVVCGVVIALLAAPDAGSAAPDRRYAVAAVALAAASIGARRFASAPGAEARTHLALGRTSLLLAASLGGLGVVVAASGGPRRTALLYALGGLLLALRPAGRPLDGARSREVGP